MRKLIVYYTFEGDTKFVGETIAEAIDADTLELKLEKEVHSKDYMKKYLGEKQVLMKTEPLLQPLDKDPQEYDVLFIGTPVWSGTYAPAIRTFFSTMKLTGKKIALFSCYTVKEGLIFKHLRDALEGNDILGEIGFEDPLKDDPEKITTRAREWAEKIVESLT